MLVGISLWFWLLEYLKLVVSGYVLCLVDEVVLVDCFSGVFGFCNLKFG